MSISQFAFEDVVKHVAAEDTLQQPGKISTAQKKILSLREEIIRLPSDEKKYIVNEEKKYALAAKPLKGNDLEDAIVEYNYQKNLLKLRYDASHDDNSRRILQEYNDAQEEFKKEQVKSKFNALKQIGNGTEKINGYLHFSSIAALLFGSSAALAFSAGAQSANILSTILDYVEFAFPIALGTLILGGMMDLVDLAARAYLFNENIDRAVIASTLIDGYAKMVLGSIALAMKFGVILAGSTGIGIPFMFLGVVMAGALKENELLKSVIKDIENLKSGLKITIKKDQAFLKQRISQLGGDEKAVKNDPRAMYLALKISENQQKLQIKEAEKKSLEKTSSLMFYMGGAAVGLLIISTLFPPASIVSAAIGVVGLLCFLLMNRLVASEKKALKEEIKTIKAAPLATERVLNTALGKEIPKPVSAAPAPKTGWASSFYSLFKNDSAKVTNTAVSKNELIGLGYSY